MWPKRNTGQTTPVFWRCWGKQAKTLTKGLRRCWRLITTRSNLERDRVMVAPSVKVFVRGLGKSPSRKNGRMTRNAGERARRAVASLCNISSTGLRQGTTKRRRPTTAISGRRPVARCLTRQPTWLSNT
jgi:hypothetical protein